MTYSRRDFGKLALAALPVSASLGKAINSKVDGVQLGVQSYSFRYLPLDESIKAMVADGLGDCEVFSTPFAVRGLNAGGQAFRRLKGVRTSLKPRAKARAERDDE